MSASLVSASVSSAMCVRAPRVTPATKTSYPASPTPKLLSPTVVTPHRQPPAGQRKHPSSPQDQEGLVGEATPPHSSSCPGS